MPRRAREKSSSGIYHIMLRGINRDNIFHDSEDRSKFVEILARYIPVCGYEIYSYCLMNNHIHLLIKEGIETIAQAMKRIGTSYVYWYNMKYERCGHLFQDRYRSEKVENESYLLVVMRYIHQNPVKGGLVKDLSSYRWSSYNEYIKHKSIVTNIEFILGIFHDIPQQAIEAFIAFNNAENKDSCLDDHLNRKNLSDKEAKGLIKQITNSDNLQYFLHMEGKERNLIIRKLKEKKLSIRQIARLTGISRRVVERA